MDYKKTFTAIAATLALGGVVLVATTETAPEGEEKLILEEVERLVLAKKIATRDDEGTIIDEDKILTIIEDRDTENAKVTFKKQSVIEGDKTGKDNYLTWLQDRKTQLEADLLVEENNLITEKDEEKIIELEKKISELTKEITDTDEAIIAVINQAADFQLIINSANKIN